MPLIRIELCDFKSYRGHQVIGPFKNFTSIIGPNGAGKSNLMDAISFVLGVRSAQLRSSQLRDLVYRGRRLARDNGEGTSQPDREDEDEEEGEGEGTAKKAWVLAVFEDEKNKEWLFQRTISMTGASEYKLNKRTVTYTTYNEALIKHNILVKAKNFLVFQGDVEAVASQSSKELTRLVEQISGSLELAAEYERAKEDQDRATENATHNFTKRRAIAGEIKQYKEQKGEAERFEALCQERDDLILRRLAFKLFRIEENLEKNADEITTLGASITGLRDEKDVQDEALEEARTGQAKARTAVAKAEKKIKRAEKALEDKKPELVAVEASIAHSTRKLNNAQKLREQVSKEVERQAAKLRGYQGDLETVQRAADEAQEAQRRASQSNLSLSEENLEEYRRLKARVSVLAVEERQALEKLTREEKTVSRTFVQLRDRQEEFERRRVSLREDSDSYETKRADLEDKIRENGEHLNKVKQQLEAQQSERARINRREAELNERLLEIHQKLMQAGFDQKESEREARLKETLANLQRIFPGVRGRLVDLCKPTQRKYESAISVILGRNIDAVVVDEERTAIDCIEYMRNQRAGQATFIPLDTIQVKPINDKFRAFAKGARLAVDVIQYESAMERAIHHACGNALVCDTMDVARYVCYEKGQEVKAVTLDGTVIHKSGLITGGRSAHENGKKWEEKDIQGLSRSRDSIQNELSELVKQKPRNKEDDNLISEMTRLESLLQVTRDDLSACNHKLQGIKDELKHIDRSLRQQAPELDKAQNALDKLREQIQRFASVVDIAEDQVFGSFCRQIGVANIRDYEARQLKLAQEESEARLRFETQIARLTHLTQFEDEQLKKLQERLNVLAETVTIEEANLTDSEEKKIETEDELERMREGIQELEADVSRLKTTLDEKSKMVDDAKRAATKAAKALEQAEKEISSRNDEIERLGVERSGLYRKCRLEEIKLPLVSGNLKNVPMEENLRDEVAMDVDEEDEEGESTQHPKTVFDYGIEVDFAILSENERADSSGERLGELDASIAKLNAEIERMTPNMKAMDRLDDVETKLAETEKEAEKARKDSKNARDGFNDVKQRRTELFNKAYDHISERIDQVYKDLTKGKAAPMGGVAYLSLEDNEEPYAGGIKYHAMPPMKRFRDMEQLSGGEKTVAALALLFAIHSYQPSPFFVLDEVDAALDNTNVAKVANYIRAHASETFQFIVISLKGSLYERGHSLVGIYRDQDVNSSRTLTLDLTQYDDES
ncbi:cohesin complex subunit psm1 [Multifurca ochricompacta]|uniref:Structural maintenance of chromosomes protein n=1 Tax=Multifurca ochricompacta TaxID=376703 RepID=A0AAD4QM08_9AGAM|nr:cohesin complex subunit psm1 [Multifurca ochricompacta]